MEEKTGENNNEMREAEPQGKALSGGRRGLVAVVLGVLVIGGALFAGLQFMGGDINLPPVVATVNGEDIERDDFRARLAQLRAVIELQGQAEALEEEGFDEALVQQTLEQMISERLVLQAAEGAGFSVSEEELEEEYGEVIDQVGGAEALLAQLASSGVTEDDLRNNLRQQLLAEKYMNERIDESLLSVSRTEAEAFYDSISGQEGVPPFADIEADIRTELLRQKRGQEIAKIVEELREDAEIERYI